MMANSVAKQVPEHLDFEIIHACIIFMLDMDSTYKLAISACPISYVKRELSEEFCATS